MSLHVQGAAAPRRPTLCAYPRAELFHSSCQDTVAVALSGTSSDCAELAPISSHIHGIQLLPIGDAHDSVGTTECRTGGARVTLPTSQRGTGRHFHNFMPGRTTVLAQCLRPMAFSLAAALK